MDSGTGHIYNQDKNKIKDIKGKLVPWEVGEEVIVKECKFIVKEISVFPADEIVLVGQPHGLVDCIEREDVDDIRMPSNCMKSFVKGLDKKHR